MRICCTWHELSLPSFLWVRAETTALRVPTLRAACRRSLSLLAEALLEQAMIGPSPNPLILSYLKYAISSQVMALPALCLTLQRCWVLPHGPN